MSLLLVAVLITLTLLLVLGGHLFFVWLLRGDGAEDNDRSEASRRKLWKALERWRRDKPRAIEDRRRRRKVRS